MLTKEERNLIKSLHKKSGREEHQLCLVEGQNAIDMAGSMMEETFTEKDTLDFNKLVTLKADKGIAGIARIPSFTLEQVEERNLVVVLDGIQDPGNMGTLFRLAFAFGASIIAIGGADPLSPKVIRSATGTVFRTPWIRLSEGETVEFENRAIFRLEKSDDSKALQSVDSTEGPVALIIGSEGNGIQSTIKGMSVHIPHNPALDSLNAATAGAIALFELSKSSL